MSWSTQVTPWRGNHNLRAAPVRIFGASSALAIRTLWRSSSMYGRVVTPKDLTTGSSEPDSERGRTGRPCYPAGPHLQLMTLTSGPPASLLCPAIASDRDRLQRIPKYHRKPTGDNLGMTECFVRAQQTVFHDREHASYVELPIVDHSASAATIYTIANTGVMLVIGQERSKVRTALAAEPCCVSDFNCS